MRWICLTAILLTTHFSFSQNKKLTAETTVEEVTVFSSGAQVQRNASVTIPRGRTEILFTGLSNQLQQQSVQLKADANLTLLSVQAVKDFTSQRKIEQDEKDLIDRRIELSEKIDGDSRLLQVYKNEEQMLIKNEAIGGQNGVKTEDLKQALDLHRQRLTEVYQKQMEIEKRIRLQQQQLTRTNQQLAEISKKKDSVTYTVTALVDSKQAQTVDFRLFYTVQDAGWFPVYDIRVADVSKPMQLVMNANVWQRSGETWKNVAVKLSTGNPQDNATPSVPDPWMLGYYDPSVTFMRSHSVQPGVVMGRITDERGTPLIGATVVVSGGSFAASTDANGFFRLQNLPVGARLVVSSVGFDSRRIAVKPGYYSIMLKQAEMALQEVVVVGYGKSAMSDDMAAPKRKATAEIQPVTVTTQYQATSTLYKIEDRYSLETDGKTTTIAIKQTDVPVLYEYFSAPKIDPSVFLTAKIVNWHELDLQPGEANLYLEGTYLGKTYIDLGSADDTLSLSLGKDNSIAVSRKLVKEFSSKKLLGSNKTESRQYEITVRNTKRVPVNIVVQDQFPVSTNKEISIEDENAPGAQVDKETGLVTWNLQLSPAREQKLQIGFAVKYPKDRKIILE